MLKYIITFLLFFLNGLLVAQSVEDYPKNNIKLNLPYYIYWIRNGSGIESSIGVAYERKITSFTSGEVKISRYKKDINDPTTIYFNQFSVELVLKGYIRHKKEKYFNGLIVGFSPYSHYKNDFLMRQGINLQTDTVKNTFNSFGGVLGYQITFWKKMSIEVSTSFLYGENIRIKTPTYTKTFTKRWLITPFFFVGYTF